MKVTVNLVSSWDVACGIAEHSAMLMDHLPAGIDIMPVPEAVDHPGAWSAGREAPLLHLNYHAGLHSRWTPDVVRDVQKGGTKVVITYHDTMAGTADAPNSDNAKALCEIADAFIVHEPVEDLPKAIYWRQGVLGWPKQTSTRLMSSMDVSARPVVGTIGFPFPWKNYTELCRQSYKAGWGVLLIAPRATRDDIEAWTNANPHSLVISDFVSRTDAVELLAECDATAFIYTCANTGTSGAIRMGIAARKPVLALMGCRQFRDLEEGIFWVENLEAFGERLSYVSLERVDPHIVRLAHQDSWRNLGAGYANLYQRVMLNLRGDRSLG